MPALPLAATPVVLMGGGAPRRRRLLLGSCGPRTTLWKAASATAAMPLTAEAKERV